MDPYLAVKLNYAFTAIALATQAGNSVYSTRNAIERRTTFNSVLGACNIIYMFSFIPLMFTSRMAVELSFFQDSPTSPFHAQFQKQQMILRIWTALYGLGTFPYVILVQIRFQVVKAVFKYEKIWLFHVRRQLNSGIEAQFLKVRRSLIFLCSMTWIGLAFSVYIYTVRTLFAPKRPTSKYDINGLKAAAGKSGAILRTAAGTTSSASLSTPTSRVTSILPRSKGVVDSGITDIERTVPADAGSPYGAQNASSSDVENQGHNAEFSDEAPPRPLNPAPKSVKHGKSFRKAKKGAPSDVDQQVASEHGADVENQLETFGVTVASPLQESPLKDEADQNRSGAEN
ncbi:hypothetical protein HDU86_007306 [Geranomyces michiganensis]|nr:hypothetical protein HDU86_007306 [Geranomyces michiganensis]